MLAYIMICEYRKFVPSKEAPRAEEWSSLSQQYANKVQIASLAVHACMCFIIMHKIDSRRHRKRERARVVPLLCLD